MTIVVYLPSSVICLFTYFLIDSYVHALAELQSTVVTLSEEAKKELVFDPDQLSYQMNQSRIAGGGIVKGNSFVSKIAGEIALKGDDFETTGASRQRKKEIGPNFGHIVSQIII